MSKTRSATGPRAIVPIDLALQGGGSHGAFTWGVLDRLLEVPWLRVDGISGTSAGAMNAVVLVDGHLKGGAEGTKEALSTFRRKVSDAALLSPFRRSLLDMLTGRGKVSGNAELSTQVLLASACVPTLLQAVEIDGDPYWDGGYAGNPTISPLVRECDANDIVLVQINPVQRPGVPRSAREIHNRLNEVPSTRRCSRSCA